MYKSKLQWHPAFYAGLQIELNEDIENLIFENEHQLGTKPKQIDVLIIKKQKDIPIKKNIGHIFRTYNIIEYKSPDDYLSIDDYYKACAYAYFYKSDTGLQNQILIEELTLTLVCEKYPKKLISHLNNVLGYNITEKYKGIFYIDKGSNIFPQQLIVTSRLEKNENIWLHSLTNHLWDANDAKELLDIYKKHKDNQLYESVLDIIIRANNNEFREYKEEKIVCNALLELMADEIAEKEKEAVDRGLAQGMAQGMAQGIAQGEDKMARLIAVLSKENNFTMITQISTDVELRQMLYKQYGIE